MPGSGTECEVVKLTRALSVPFQTPPPLNVIELDVKVAELAAGPVPIEPRPPKKSSKLVTVTLVIEPFMPTQSMSEMVM